MACFVDIQTSHPPCMLLCLQRNSAGSENPSDAFRFLVEERIQCCQSRRVRYTQRVDYCIQLPAPIEAATNRGKGAPRRTHTHKMFCWHSWHDAGLRWHQLLGVSRSFSKRAEKIPTESFVVDLTYVYIL